MRNKLSSKLLLVLFLFGMLNVHAKEENNSAPGKTTSPLKYVTANVTDNFRLKRTMPHAGNEHYFIENKGQVTDQHGKARNDIQFKLCATPGLNIFVGNGAIHYQFSKCTNPDVLKQDPNSQFQIPDARTVTYDMYRMDVELVGANKNAKVIAEQQQAYYENFFTPTVGEKGATAHAYKRIIYKDVYPNIDWVLYMGGAQMKHEFVVREGGKVSDIKLKYGGATGLQINNGNLVANTPQGTITEDAPYTYQKDGKKISSGFKLEGDVLSYTTGAYTGELVIDPNVNWGTYYGGSSTEYALSTATDASGNVYIAGYTFSSGGGTAIATTGSHQDTYAGGTTDAFLAKFNSSGVRQWATYYGGSSDDAIYDVATDGSGNVYATGWSFSTSGIATTGSHQDTHGGGAEGFLAKFNSSGVRQWATYYGGSGTDQCSGVATDGSGDVYITGITTTTSGTIIATTGSHQDTHSGSGNDGFLAKFNSSGVRQWATYYGGTGTDQCNKVVTDGSGDVYITGYTSTTSGTTIATTGSHQDTHSGSGNDGFLAKFNSSGVRQWATYYGGAGDDQGSDVATDGSGNVYITGNTATSSGTAIATTGAHQDTYGGSTADGFLAKFNSSGVRQWGTYYGGSGWDQGQCVAIDGSGNVYIGGETTTSSGTAIATTSSHQDTHGGGTWDGYLAQFNSSGVRQWATYYGGSATEQVRGMAKDGSGNMYIAGYSNTNSGTAVATAGSHQSSNGGSYDAFLASFSINDNALDFDGTDDRVVISHNSALSLSSGSMTIEFWANPSLVNSAFHWVVSKDNGNSDLDYLIGLSSSNNWRFIIRNVGVDVVGTSTPTAGTWYHVVGVYDGTNAMLYVNGILEATVASAGSGVSNTENVLIGARTASSPSQFFAGTIEEVRIWNRALCAPELTNNASGELPSPATQSGLVAYYKMNSGIAGGTNTGVTTATDASVNGFNGTLNNFALTGAASNWVDGTINTTASAFLTPTSNVTICNGQSTGLSVSGGTSYIWSPSASLSASTGSSVTANPTSTTVYTITEGCGATATVQVSVNPLPTVSGGSNVAICNGSNTVLTASGASTYAWAPGASLSATTGTSVTATPTSTTAYTVTGTNTNGCANTATVTVTVNPLPAAITSTGADIISTITGTGTNGFSGDGAAATAAQINTPRGMVTDGVGNIYIADMTNHRIRKISPSGIITTFAGTGTAGYSGDGGAATAADIQNPAGIATDASGNVYIADMFNHRIRMVNTSGIISTFAGAGTASFSGDGSAATAAELNYPTGVGVDGSGNVYISDGSNHRVRKVSSGIITTFAGTGTSGYSGDGGAATAANIWNPSGIVIDGSNNVYIADLSNDRVRKVNASGIITTFAGTGSIGYNGDGIAATAANIWNPWGITIDGSGNICFSDLGHYRIRKVSASGIISTFAGVGTSGFSGDGGPATAAQTNYLYGVAIDGDDNVYFADPNNSRIRKVSSGIRTMCVGSSITMSNTSSGGTWSASNSNVSLSGTASTTVTVTGVTGGAANVTYTLATGCYKVAAVTVNALPTVSGGSNVAICTGSNTALTASGATTYTWAPSTTLSASTGASVTATPTVTTTYTVTGTNANGCINTGVVTVTVNPLPTVSGGSNVAICIGSNTTLTASGASTYTWAPSTTLSASTGTSVTATPTVTTTYTVTGTDANGCYNTATVTVTVNSYPVVAAITGNTTLSTTITTDLDNATAGGVWASAATGTATINSTTGVVTGVAAGTALISYTVTTSGCSTTVTTNVTVNTPQNGLNFDGTNDYVAVSGSTGIPSGNSQYTIEAWIKPTAGGIYGIAGWGNYGANNEVTAFRLTNATTLHHYWWFNDLSATVPNLVDGNWHHVVATYDGTTRAIYCDGALVASDAPSGHNVTITNNVTVGRTYTAEYFPGSLDEVRIWNVGRTQAQIRANMNCDVAQQAGLVAYYRFNQGTASGTNTGLTGAFDYSGNGNCGTITNLALTGGTSNYVTGAVGGCNTISDATPGSFSGNSPVCVGSTITLANANTGGIWSTASGNITINSTSGLVTGVTGGTATVNYTLNCNTSSVIVTINALPTVSGGSNVAICTGSNTVLTASGASTYTWTPGATLSATTGTSVTATPTVTTTYTVTGTDANTCTNTAIVTVTVNSYPVVAAITGNTTVSTAITTDLDDATGGGVWTSAASGTATVNSTTGVVTGVSAGTVLISYTVTTSGCATTVTTNVTVNTPTNALSFDGGNDAVDCGNPTAMQLTTGTVEAWIKTSGAGSGHRGIVVKQFAYGLLLNNNILGAYDWNTGDLSTGVNVADGNWHHVAMSFDNGVINGTKIYLDGVLSLTTTWTVNNQSHALSIGQSSDVSGGPFENFAGTIDEVRIWNTIRSQTQIAANMNCDIAQQAGLEAYYRFDQGTASGTNTGLTCAYDYSGNSHSGTISNFALTGGTSNYVTGAVGNCNTATPIAPGSFSGNTPVCVGQTITLGNANTGGVWSVGSGSGSLTVNSTSGLVTGVSSGTVTVNYTLNCSSSSVTVTVNPLPSTSGGSNVAICIGGSTGLTASGASTYTWAPAATLSASTGASVTATPTVTTVYTVTGTSALGCVNPATITVTVTPYSGVYSITGGGPYCSGAAGATIGLSNSDVGYNYQLIKGAGTLIGSPVAGTGAAISFGAQPLAGLYTATVTSVAAPGCVNSMSGSTVVSILSSPAAVNVTGGGSVCGGGPGVPVGLAGSAVGVQYQLYLGASPVGSPVGGVGGSFNFGTFTTLGTYTATATNTVNACTSNMTGSAVINAAAGITTYTVTGTGSYCAGGTGVAVGLSSSTSGISYQLFIGGTTAVGSPVIGTGAAISFGLQTTAGTYTVVGTNTSTGCFGNMTGSAVITIDPLPNIHTVTGGGVYCSGGTGVAIGLSLSQTGVNYQLYVGASPSGSPVAGTGSAISFGLLTAAGTYTVTAINTTTSCTNGMGGSVTVSINPLPTVTAGGAATVCAGSPTPLTVSGAVTYAWSPAATLSASTGSSVTASPTSTTTYTVAGTDANGCVNTDVVTVTVNPLPTVSGGSNVAICTGLSTGLTATGAVSYIWAPSATLSTSTGASVTANPTSTTTYSVTGTDGNSCVNTATVTVSVNPLPTVSGGANVGICTGASTGLTASGASTYTWAPGATLSATTGSSVTATPGSTTTYTVTGTDANGCVNDGTVTVSVNPLPTVSGGSDVAICAGASSVLTASGATTYSWTPAGGLSATTGTSVTASPTVTTTYTVTGSTSGCNNSATVTVSVNPLPSISAGTATTVCAGVSAGLTASGASTYIWVPSASLSASTGSSVTATPSSTTIYTVSGTDANSCVNTATVMVSVNPLPSVSTGAGSVICATASAAVTASGAASYTWSPAGTLSASTGASVTASPTVTTTYTVTGTSAASCTNTASVTITVNPLPTDYAMTGGGSYCSATSGVAIGVAGSDVGINYQLYRTGFGAVGSPVAGTGAAISFGSTFTIAGTYTVTATNTSTGCNRAISTTVTVTPYPSPAIIPVTGGGSYCVGGTGVAIGLAASAVGVNYQLMLGATPVGSPIAGVGSSLSFGSITTAGTYTVTATNPVSGCTNPMSGSATVSVYAALTTYTVTGGGSYCSGGSGMAVGLNGSAVGVNYQLYRGGSPLVGTTIAGTGTALNFGSQTIAGTYTVVATHATNGCTATMSGSAVVAINTLPTAYTVTGGGSYCSGGAGLTVGISNSDVGVDYQLYRGASTVGSPVAGTGAAINFGTFTTAGTYTVVATNTSTSCSNSMSGSVTITINSLPAVYTVSGGGSYCSGTGLYIYLSGSNGGINYQLYNGASTVGSPVAGTGGGLTFGPFTTPGTYTVVATNTITSCTSNMSGSGAIVGVSLPTAYNVTGGGSYCSGGAGMPVGLSSSDAGINYQLYRGATTVGSPVAGTGSALAFGSQTTAGTYTVVATNVSLGCTSTMTGSAVVSVNPLPVAVTVTGGGSYCAGGAGVAVGLSGSAIGIDYQLYNGASTVGSPVGGVGSSFNFGTFTTAGTYTVTATNSSTGCTNNMSGSATISINALPTAYAVTGGGSYCSGSTGVAVGLGNSQTGVNYQLYNGASPVGSPVAGTGIAITFGIQTTAGTYTVNATTASTGCTNGMSGSATVTINSLPTLYTVTGGGAYCSGGAGATIGLSNSDAGVNYQLYNGALTVGSSVAGTGSSFNFGTYTLATTYTVTATNATTGCVRNMSGSATISVNSLPAAVPVTGGGTICIGGTGVAVGLSASATGVNYQLYVGATPTGSPVAGVGGALSFGLQTTIGTYTVIGTNATTGCSNTMSGSAVISNYTPPTAFAVTGTGGYCTGGTGLAVGLVGSATGVTYQLYRGATTVGSPLSGTGSALSFGLQTVAGTYTVVGTTTSNGCTGNMTGSAVITVNSLPNAYTVTGGGGYCTGGSGVVVGLGNSDAGVDYQLYRGATPVGSPVSGTGSSISFGLQTIAGTYTVTATNTTTTCTNNMAGFVTVTINPLPTAYSLSGGGSYCTGPGINIYLSSSDAGVNYQLWDGATPIGSPVAGTGTTLTFGPYTTATTYTVTATNATTGCTNNMTGSATISGSSLPAIYTVSGGGNYCSGGTGVAINLSNSDLTVNYQLYLGASPVGSPVAGTGSALNFGLQTAAGTYTVLAINLGSSCTQTMSSSATVTIDPPPASYTVSGGGSLCAGGAGVSVSLSSSDAGVDYQLKLGATPVGSPLSGTGSALNFGPQTTAGTYTVAATDFTSTCSATMTGFASVTVNPLPTVSAGTGSVICATASATLTASGAASYTWTPSATLSASTGASVTASPTVTTTYTVTGTSAFGCTNTASVTVTVNPLPTDYAFTGGGTFCAGGSGYPIGLVGSDAGVNYQLYWTSATGTISVGSLVAGTGSAISMGTYTPAGVYSIIATNATTGCTRTLSGSTTIVVNAPPAAVTVTGGGSYCSGGSGVSIGLAASAIGVNYQVWLGATPIGSPVAGVGSGMSLGTFTTAGTYSVTATSTATGCSSNMTGSATVSVYSALTSYTVTGGGSYCSGTTGVTVGLSGSSSGVSYQLYLGGSPLVGTTTSGTGAPVSFGLQTTAGTYTIVATNTSTGCTANMSGSVVVSINSLPTAFTVTGGGSYCTGGSGVAVGLGSSTSGVNYQLYRGATPVGSPVAGTGSAITFGLQTTAGNYTVVATNATTSCTSSMTGSVSVSINSLPFVFTVSGGGSYCAGGSTGPNIFLGGSVGLTTYQLYLGSTPVGSPVSGTGGGINFGTFTAVGTYSVSATSTTTGCTNNMSGTATVSTIALPIAYTVTGGGSYCTGGTGVTVGLSGSNTGITYQLYRGATYISSLTGTGSALNFGTFTTAGTYTVVAYVTSTSCTANMTGSATISINSLPFVFSVTGGGSYCSGGVGVIVGLSSSAAGTNYQLYRSGSPVGSPVAGTGTAISFGLQTTAGTYTVVATNTVTGCTANMTGSATVTVNSLPTVFTVTGGGSYCSGGTGVSVGLSGSQAGVNYQLYIGGTPTGSPVAGTGSAISFGSKTAAGTYTVVATNASTTCTSNMTGSATVSINALPTAFTVTGGGAYCSGGSGVIIGVGNSTSGVNYQLYRGATAVGSPVAGTGSAISFPSQTIASTYTVTAVNTTTGCTAPMTGSATVSINSAPTICSMTGGGAYCSGGTGVAVGLGASISGVNYQLYIGGTPTGSPVAGVGGTLSFGNQTAAGTYTAVATNAAGCSSAMSGSVVVSINSSPASFTVTGGGAYCSGSTGVSIGLSGSVTGTTYKLYQGATPVTSPVSGTGAGLNFGTYTSAGTYTVKATITSTGCVSTMTGSAGVTVNPVPTYTSTRYTVAPAGNITLNATPTGGTWTCANTSVATIGSASGIVTGVALGTTTVTYTLSTGCFAPHSLAVTPTGFREGQGNTTGVQTVATIGDLHLVPNPTRSSFTIKGSLVTDDKEVTLHITNMLGQVVYNMTTEVKDGEINGMVQLPYDVPNGMYLVTLHTTTDTKVFHLVIEK